LTFIAYCQKGDWATGNGFEAAVRHPSERDQLYFIFRYARVISGRRHPIGLILTDGFIAIKEVKVIGKSTKFSKCFNFVPGSFGGLAFVTYGPKFRRTMLYRTGERDLAIRDIACGIWPGWMAIYRLYS
jgi:hypothetical protein